MDDDNEIFELNEDGKPYKIAHRCFYFSKEVILFIKECKYDRIHFSLFDQLIRSATSVGANVVEGRAGSSKKDWRNFYAIALKSANETKYWLCLIKETIEVSKTKADELIKEADEISKIIASIIVKSDKSTF
ncbi:MAG: four helix bundle protein [Ferruginibacter sp.]